MTRPEGSRPFEEDSWDEHDIDEDTGEELEARIEHADRPFASESFGTTAEEQEEGESLDQRLREEGSDRPALDRQIELEDDDVVDEEEELIGEASPEHDHFVAPEDAAVTVRDIAPGAVDHQDDEDLGFDRDTTDDT
jgi:hypothetical protein